MFSYHSLILHHMLLLSEKINNRLAIWNVSGMFGKVDCKVSNHIEGVILSIQVSKVLLTSYHTNHKEIKYFEVTLYFLRILKMFWSSSWTKETSTIKRIYTSQMFTFIWMETYQGFIYRTAWKYNTVAFIWRVTHQGPGIRVLYQCRSAWKYSSIAFIWRAMPHIRVLSTGVKVRNTLSSKKGGFHLTK